MNKKLVIGGIVLLLIVGGGAFLLLSGRETKPGLGELQSDTIPTKWSQAGDYKIEETPAGTIVTNSKAGFSFKVPENWSIRGEQGVTTQSYGLILSSPDVEIKESKLSMGCSVVLETIHQEDRVLSVSAIIKGLKERPDIFPDKTLVEIDNQEGTKTLLTTSLDEFIQVELPIDDETLLDFELHTLVKNQGDCLKNFEEFLSEQ